MVASTLSVFAASCALALLPAGRAWPTRRSGGVVNVNTATTYQSVDGFGCSEAFGRAEDILALSSANQNTVLNLLFDVNDGAGFTILRNDIGSGNSTSNGPLSIEPFAPKPDSPSGTPTYSFDKYDTGQFPITQQALDRKVPNIYANAWSAPGYMKTNGDQTHGGYLCGVTGESCSTGNWMQAYANYLVQYVTYYQQNSIDLSQLGFINEPSYTTAYSSMNSNGTQAADFIRVLGATIEKAGLDIELTCCDDFGWKQQSSLLAGLQAKDSSGKSAQDYLSIITGHGYGSAPTFPLATPLRTWLTEWADLSGDYYPTTFYNNGGPAEGLTWASNIQVAFTNANVSAFLYWIGAENNNASSSLITFGNGNQVIPSKRFWAFASFSRFVRPGAQRVAATVSGASSLTASAFKNSNGAVAVQVINSGSSAQSITLQFGTPGAKASITPYVTDNQYDLQAQTAITLDSNGNGAATVPAYSLVSFVSS